MSIGRGLLTIVEHYGTIVCALHLLQNLRFAQPGPLSNGAGRKTTNRMQRIVILLLLAAISAFGADVTGAWKGSMETPGGAMEIAANLKAEGSSVTGTVNAMGTDEKIQKGKLDGEKISFEIVSEMGTVVYAGTLAGDEMKLVISVMDQQMPLVLKRVKQ
jgi:hypothetical protein